MAENLIWLIDEHAYLHHNSCQNHNMACTLTMSFWRSLSMDSKRRAEGGLEDIIAYLEPTPGNPNLCGAYTVIKRCYWHESVRATNPSWADMEKVLGNYGALYSWEDLTLSGRPVPTQVTPFRFNYNVPLKAEVEALFWWLRLNKAGGLTHIHADHFKKWLREAYPVEGTYTPPQSHSGGRSWWDQHSTCDSM